MSVRSRVLMLGGIMGALLGVGAAHLYLRSVPESLESEEQLPSIQPGDALRVGLTVLTAVRAIVGLAQPGRKGSAG